MKPYLVIAAVVALVVVLVVLAARPAGQHSEPDPLVTPLTVAGATIRSIP